MELGYALILGIIQGITEWLPVSSSAHLALAHKMLGIGASPAFDVALHAGTLLAVLLAFRKEYTLMLKALLRLDCKSPAGKTLTLIILATIPGAVAGYLFKDVFESLFSNTAAIGIALIITAALLYAASKTKGVKDVTTKEAAIIGLAQAISIAPGISRSGSTIAAAMLSGVERNKAAMFSLLLSVPIILGAAVYELRKASLLELEPMPTLIGITASFIVGYASIRVLLKFVKESKLQYFAYYCAILGIICITFLANLR